MVRVLLRGRRGDGKKPLKEADHDSEDGKDDQQGARPGTTHDALAVQDPEGRTAQQEEECDPQRNRRSLSCLRWRALPDACSCCCVDMP